MSADNYYTIQPHPNGTGFAAVMQFMSNDNYRVASERDKSYSTLEDALEFTYDEYVEYGTRITPEALDRSRHSKVN